MSTPRNRVLAVVSALLAVSACAGIPSSGPVTKVADDGGLGESTVRYSPTGPAEGASPQEIVRGYLDAMLAYPMSSGTASSFLTPDGAKGWAPAERVRVYSLSSVSGPRLLNAGDGGTADKTRTPVEITVNLSEDARLDRQGHYTRRTKPSEVSYLLERVEGEWRITNPQAGMLVSQKFFDDYFRPFDIYYFDRPGGRLLPDPIHVVVGDQLPTALLTSLGRGPGASTEGAARTYLPPLDELRPSVPVSEDGVADVEFDTDFGAISESAQDHLSAQLVWTLRQAPGVTAVRIVGGATTLTNGGNAEQPVSSWKAYGPSIVRGRAYALKDDKIVQIDRDEVKPISGTWGKDALGATSIAVSSDGVAGVLAGRSQVRITSRKGASARTFDGTQLITPRWDDDGNVWLVDRPGPQTRVRLVTGMKFRTLDIGGLAALDPTTFALSPDGSRYAVTVSGGRGSIRVGRVLRDAKDRILGLGEPSRVHLTAGSPRSVTWLTGTQVSYLANSGSGRQVYSTAIDGSSTSGGLSRGGPLLPDVGARALAIGPGEEPVRYATDARNRLWLLSPGESWRLLPGKGVTGLTYGR